MRSWGVALLSAALAGCAAPSPFPVLPPMDEAQTLALLAERTACDEEIYAELEFDYEDAVNSGSFDVVAVFTPPAAMEMVAFKDLVVTQEDIFEMSFQEDGYRFFLVHGPDGEEVLSEGPLAEFPDEHPRFRGFFWGREAFVLPGKPDPEQLAAGEVKVRDLADNRQQITTRLASGARVDWLVASDTLQVLSAQVTSPDGEPAGSLRYSRWFLKDGRFWPRKLVFEDPPQDVKVTVYVDLVEVGEAEEEG